MPCGSCTQPQCGPVGVYWNEVPVGDVFFVSLALMHNRVLQICPLAALSWLLCACGGSSGGAPPPPPVETRAYELGFTPWPYDATVEAVNFVYSEVALRGDFIAHHLDGGIPWQEALDGTAYSAELDSEINTRLVNTPPDKRTYLALSPLNGGRDGLADYWGTAPNQSLPQPWDTLPLNDPDVITAYTNFAAHLIGQFGPDYFNLGIEVSELAINDSVAYDELVNFTEAVSGNLKTQFPSVQMMISVALKSPGSAAAATIRAELPRMIQHVDVVGVSVYPYIFFDHADRGDPANLPSDWLSQITQLAGGKPIAIAETGWAAEAVTIVDFGVDIASDPANQDAYLETLFATADALNARFIVWFALVDYDALWNGVLQQDPVAEIWRDIGLYDENLNPRPALGTWMEQIAVPLE